MKSAIQIAGIVILLGTINAWVKYYKQHPDWDLLDDPVASGECMGLLLMSAIAVGLICYGFQKVK